MLLNFRDLGGMKTKDGKSIVKGKLYRSGMLCKANEEDIRNIKSIPITRIIDFRTPKETEERPDPAIDGTEYLNLPPVIDFQTGIARESNTDASIEGIIKKSMKDDPDFAKKYFTGFYIKLVGDDYAMSQYAKFFRLLAEDREGATLWHCTAGKDRAGAAAVFLEEILGVDRDTIVADYMVTNEYLEDDIQYYIDKVKRKYFIVPRKKIERPMRDCFGARMDYIEATYKVIDEKHGGMEAFLRDKLGVDDELKNTLREKYLE